MTILYFRKSLLYRFYLFVAEKIDYITFIYYVSIFSCIRVIVQTSTFHSVFRYQFISIAI